MTKIKTRKTTAKKVLDKQVVAVDDVAQDGEIVAHEESIAIETKETNKDRYAIDLSKYGKRTPLMKQKRVGFKCPEGWTARLVNDSPGRINQFLDAGWELVEDESLLDTDNRMQLSKGTVGTHASAIVNTRPDAKTTLAYWMIIPTAIYEQDQKEKERLIDIEAEKLKPQALKEDHNVTMGADFSNKY